MSQYGGWAHFQNVNARVAQLGIFVLAACTLLLSGEVLLHGAAFKAGVAGGPSESFLLPFFSRLMIEAFPKNLSVVLRLYAVATMLAAGLAMVLVVRPQRSHTTSLMGFALSGLAFFAAYYVLARHVRGLAGTSLLVVFDYVGMVIFAYALHAIVRIALIYPQPLDDEAFLAFKAKSNIWTRNIERHLRVASLTRYQLKMIRSTWWPCGLAACGCALVALLQLKGSGTWLNMAGFFLICCPVLLMPDLTLDVLGWNYRLSTGEVRNQLAWFSIGVFLGGLLVGGVASGSVLCALAVDSLVGGNGVDSLVGAVGFSLTRPVALFTALTPPLLAIATVLFLGGSIFFFGAIDARLAIRKTSLYGIATLLLIAGLTVAQNTAVTHLVAKFGLPGNSGSMFAGVVVALAFAPMRRHLEVRVERVIDRVLPASALAEAQRETTTVVFADLSGYTELSAKDEPKALTLASLLHKESRRLAERHNGRLVKSIGDAVMLSFHEPGEAAHACIELRDKFAAAANLLELPALPLHFGLHAGEVVRDKDGDIYGGTVNLAARLQGVAQAGQIVASDSVATVLAGGNFALHALGTKVLKNVPMPVNCFLVT